MLDAFVIAPMRTICSTQLSHLGYDFIYPKFGVRHRTVWYIATYVSGERATCISTVDGDYDLPDYTASYHGRQ
jgi:hypothetical protein